MAGRHDVMFQLPKDAIDDLSCVVCLENKSLLLFPCQHRCCKECTDQIKGLSSSLPGPICRVEVDIPECGLPVCRLTEALRNQLKIVDGGSEDIDESAALAEKCQSCPDHIEMRCKTCSKFLCCRCSLKTACDQARSGDRHDLEDLEVIRKRTDAKLETWIKNSLQEIAYIDTELEKLMDSYNQFMTERRQKSAKVSSVEAVVASNVGVVGRMELAEQIDEKQIAYSSSILIGPIGRETSHQIKTEQYINQLRNKKNANTQDIENQRLNNRRPQESSPMFDQGVVAPPQWKDDVRIIGPKDDLRMIGPPSSGPFSGQCGQCGPRHPPHGPPRGQRGHHRGFPRGHPSRGWHRGRGRGTGRGRHRNDFVDVQTIDKWEDAFHDLSDDW